MANDNIHPLFPPTSRPPESIPVRSVRELDQVAEAARAAIGGALTLNRLANSPLGNVSQAAQTAQSTLRRMILPPARRTKPSRTRRGPDRAPAEHNPDLVPTALFSWGRRLDDVLTEARGRAHRPESRLTRLLSPVWSWLGLAVTGVAAALVMTQHWFLAAGVLAARVAVSRWIGDETNRSRNGRVQDPSSSTIMYRCVAAHLCDCIMLLAVIWVLLSVGASQWAVVGTVAIATMLLGTLSRVAALQVGVQIFRLTLERIFRTAAVLIALLLTGLWQPDVASASTPLLGVAFLGCLLFGLGELVRTQLRVRYAVHEYGATPAVSITVEGKRTMTTAVRTGFREAS